jgi:hypothetical protein
VNNQASPGPTSFHKITHRVARTFPLAVVILTAIAVFYLVTIRAGQRWGDDFSMYILHARNIVQGSNYQDTGYLYDPFTAVIGPRFYPPVFPLALAPLYALFGLNLTSMKVEVICFFISFICFYLAFRMSCPPLGALRQSASIHGT